MEQVYDLLENNLNYVGSSAIEDTLQDGVPETLESLRQAGIVCWMLTGDKKETAIQIGYSCKLIPGNLWLSTNDEDSNTVLVSIEGTDNTSVEREIQNALHEISKVYSDVCLVVEGGAVDILLEKHVKEFLRICKQCCSVICCRLSPIQKGKVNYFKIISWFLDCECC